MDLIREISPIFPKLNFNNNNKKKNRHASL